jgi:hypothetical protein
MKEETYHNNIQQIESTLQKGVPDTLSLSERTDMKRVLFSRIDGQVKRAPVRSPFFGFLPRIALGAVFASVMLVFTGVAADQSMPGDALYMVKLKVMEPVTRAFEIPDADPVAEQIWLLERRLDEARILEANAVLNGEAATVLLEEVSESARAVELEVDAMVHADTSKALVSIDRVSALLEAHDELLTNHDLANMLSLLSYDVDDARNEAVADMLQNAASTSVSEYINASLHDIAASLEDGNLSPGTIDSIEGYIEEVATALTEADYAETVEHISEANQRILVEAYLSVVIDENGTNASDTDTGFGTDE